MTKLTRFNLLASLVIGLGLAGAGCGEDHSSHNHSAPPAKAPEAPAAAAASDPTAKPYPLKVCIVSGEALGSMGEPMKFTYKGQEIKLCCKGCDKKFQAEPDKFIEKIAAAATTK